MTKNYLLSVSVFGCTAVLFGAFGAHQLKEIVSPYSLEIWQKAVAYQFYHTFALALVALLARSENAWLKRAYWAFFIGILLFCGSLYLMAINEVFNFTSTKILGPFTPIGGLFFIFGWLSLLFFAASKNK